MRNKEEYLKFISFLEKRGVKDQYFKNFFTQLLDKNARYDWDEYSWIYDMYPNPKKISRKKLFFAFFNHYHINNIIDRAFDWSKDGDIDWESINQEWEEGGDDDE